jgi:hypothetical protein
MKKVLIALAAAATIAAGSLSAPSTAEARCQGCGIGAGIIGGLAAGAIIGGAVANSYPRYAPAPGYVVYDGYSAAYPVAWPGGYWGSPPIGLDPNGNAVRWGRGRINCPETDVTLD